jgi:hypothetical protein
MRLEDLIGPGKKVTILNVNLTPESDKKPILNPGIEYGSDGKAKWSPPLQQQLSTMKDAVGVETEDVTVEPTAQDEKEAKKKSKKKEKSNDTEVETEDVTKYNDIEVGTEDVTLERLKKLAAVFSPHNFPAG